MIAPYIVCFLIACNLIQGVFSENTCETTITRTVWENVFDPLSRVLKTVFKYKLINCKNVSAEVISYGASISSIITPDHNGNWADVVLGFKNMNGYLSLENAFLGATLGRVANRIGGGVFKIRKDDLDTEYVLDKNDGNHTIHGGPYSFGKVFWEECPSEQTNTLTLCHKSPDGEGGFPGYVEASITYKLTNENELSMVFRAKADKTTPINMANHAYFNLAGHNAGAAELYEHYVQIFANKYTPVGTDLIPTGQIKQVSGTRFDLRNWSKLGTKIFADRSESGYDNNFIICCQELTKDPKIPCISAKIFHPKSKRMLTIYSTQPGLQFYTANTLNVMNNGKDQAKYNKHSSFAMESQNFPNAVNQPNFPNSLLEPNQIYYHETVYMFKTTTLWE